MSKELKALIEQVRMESERLKSLINKTSSGPWQVEVLDDDACMSAVLVTAARGAEHPDLPSKQTDGWPAEEVIAITLLQQPYLAASSDRKFDQNAEFISEVRNTLPILLSRIDLLLKEIE